MGVAVDSVDRRSVGGPLQGFWAGTCSAKGAGLFFFFSDATMTRA